MPSAQHALAVCCERLRTVAKSSCGGMQRLVKMRVGAGVVLAIIHVAGALCGIMGLLGALQALPAVAVMTSAVVKSAGKLAEFAVMVVAVLALAAMILYNGVIADERLTVRGHLTSFMLLSTIHGAIWSYMHTVP